MAPRTERFEMRIDEQTIESIDNWRAEQTDFPTRSEAIRRLIAIGINGQASIQLSNGERLIIAMLLDILKQNSGKATPELDPDFIGEVLYGGHYWAFAWELHGLFHSHRDNPEDVKYVVDVLDLWDFLEEGYEALSEEEKESVKQEAEPFGESVHFVGFDGNNEATYLSIARFLVEKMDRFQRFKGRDFNSHCPRIDVYKRMLSVFSPIRSTLIGRSLGVKEIVEIVKARKHPSM